jgi:hypothetical protein
LKSLLLTSCLSLQPVNRQGTGAKQTYVLGIQLCKDYTSGYEAHGYGLQFLADLLKQETVGQHLTCQDDRFGVGYADQVHNQACHRLGCIVHNLCAERVALAAETIDLFNTDPLALLRNEELRIVVSFQETDLTVYAYAGGYGPDAVHPAAGTLESYPNADPQMTYLSGIEMAASDRLSVDDYASGNACACVQIDEILSLLS